MAQQNVAVVQKYEYIEHTGDLGFKAYGATREALFVHAAEALFEILVSLESVQEKERRTIEVKASGLDGLMVGWLGELLYLFDTEGLLQRRFEIRSMQHNRLTADVVGEVMDLTRHEIKTGIKAVTYHQLYVRRANATWESQVILDL